MPLAVTCQFITEINKFQTHNHLSAGAMELDLEELANQYIIRNEADKTLPRQCTLCGKLFRDMFNAKMHLDSAHFPSANGYFCEICNKPSKSRSSLSKHYANYHKNK